MRLLPLIVRVLLSLSLILNGSGYAMASAHMRMEHADVPAPATQQAPVPVAAAEPPCHQHHQDGASESAAQLPDATPDAPVKSKHPSPDCCKSGACGCACVTQVQAAIPAYSLGDAVIGHIGVVRSLKPGHAAPALPHLIRPPIG